jgi:L-fuconolactonase
LKGVRHVLQAEEDAYFARQDFNVGVALLRRYGLAYDVLIVERQLPAAIEFVDRHPDQVFVLDHLAKPLIAAQAWEPWRTGIRELARRPHIACKISGMVTEADFDRWTAQDLRPYLDTVLEAFGPSRLLFGSDWPVCTAASEYGRWVRIVEEWSAPLTEGERAMIFGGNAVEWYRLREAGQSKPGPMREVQFS